MMMPDQANERAAACDAYGRDAFLDLVSFELSSPQRIHSDKHESGYMSLLQK